MTAVATIRSSIVSIAVAFAALAAPAAAQLNREVPAELQNVDIVEKLDAPLPLDLPFLDESGATVRLGDFFKGDKPVILQLGYLRCPMLCNLVLNGLVEGMKGVDWTAGDKFEVVAISINPSEPHQLAKAKRDGYAVEYGRSGGERGMHFLTGPETSSHAVAEAVGFGFSKQMKSDGGVDYSHAAALFLITPDGRVSRYLYGTRFEPRDLRMGILEASEGKIGTTLDRFILWCHVYDPNARGYVLFATRLMQLGGLAMVIVLGVGLTILWRQDLKRRSADAGAAVPEPRR